MFKLMCVMAFPLLACSAAAASFLYQSAPSTGLDASAGFNAGGTDYFLLKLRIYHPAKGIAAFPDGGQPKDVFESIYLFKLDKSGPRKVAELGMAADLSSAYFKSSEIRDAHNGVLIKIPWMNRKYYSKKLNPDKKGSARKEECYLFDPASAKISVVKDPGGEWPKETLSLSETNDLFRYRRIDNFSDFDAFGLPNPLDYLSGSGKPENLVKLILKGLGDRHLRLAAARRLITSGHEDMLRQAIADFDERTSSINAYYRNKDYRNQEKELFEKLIREQEKKKGE